MWRSVSVLLWKSWRVKQRNSRLNRDRNGKRWLFPALVTDIVMPTTLSSNPLLDLDGLLASVDDDADDGNANVRRRMTPLDDNNMEPTDGTTSPTSEPVTLLLAVLPLLLARSNQSLAFLDRGDTVDFLRYLNRQYPGASELGIASYMDVSHVVPFNSTMSNDEATEVLLEFPESSGVTIYAGLDVRKVTAREEAEESDTLELLALFSQSQLKNPSQGESETQVAKFVFNELTFNGSTMSFPFILPFQVSLNMLIRESSTSFANNEAVDISDLSPDILCQTVNKMLNMGGLRWGAFPASSPLGRSVLACKIAVTEGKLSEEIKRFLSSLIGKVASTDGLDVLAVSTLPNRPTDTMSGALEGNIVFYMAYLFMWPYVRLICDVVGEKEGQLKEYLMIMGLPATALLTSWFLLYIMASAAVALIGTWLLSGVMFTATLAGEVYFFLLLIAFVSSILLFGIAITPLFNQTKTAASCAPLVFFVLSAGAFIRSLVGPDAVASSTSLASLLSVLDGISSPVVFMATLHNILSLDAVTVTCRPITWNTVATPYRLLASQCAGYLLLGWYLENVFPRTYGVQQKWYFVFQSSYWFPKNLNTQSFSDVGEDGELARLTEMGFESIDDRLDDTLREQTLSEYMQHFRPSLFVRSLSKTYPNGKVALKNVSFGVRKGEIFGLLGPNGAGKSTTLSMLSGIIPPTSGDAYVGGSISVATNPQAVRKSLSVCFQQNILYDNLTVWEHLSLVCALKNSMGIKTVSEETWPAKLRQFGLDEKHDALSKTLSGGQKRKLSLVLALLDSSRVLLLDEPTAGMDLKARLDTWDTLKRAVTHRAVILTTHSMQEAQALCENIGIVADGKLKCCGSSLFLRNQYGVGYKLTVSHGESADQDDDRNHLRSRRQTRTGQLMTVLTKYVPNATIMSDSRWETRVQLNDGEEKHLAGLFKELETMKQASTIKRYAIAATGLEDVFVKVTEGEGVYNHARDDIENDESLGSVDPVHSKMESGKVKPKMGRQAAGTDRQLSEWESSVSKIRAMILKRAKMSSRDKKALFAQFVWPLGFLAILMGVLQNLLTSGASIETMTTLPPSAMETSFFISSAPSASDSVLDIVAQMELSSHPIVFDRNVQTEQAMLDTIASDRATTYFAGVFVSDVNWTTPGKLSSEAMVYSLYYNETVRRSLPVTLQWLSQAYCKVRVKRENAPGIKNCELIVQKGVYPDDIKIGTGVSTGEDGAELDIDEAVNVVQRIMVAFYLLMTMSSMIGYYAALVVREKECGLKRLQYQHLGTANASVLYWSSNLLFDYMTYTLAVVAIYVILMMFSAALNSAIIAAWLVSMAFFGLAILPAQYFTSLVFSSHATAQSYMSYASLFQIVAVSVVFALSMVPGLCGKANTIAYFLQAFPLYTFGTVVLEIVTVSWAPMRQQCLKVVDDPEGGDLLAMFGKLGTGAQSSVWDWNVSGNKWFALLMCSVIYTSLLIAVDYYQMYPTEAKHRMRLALSRGRLFFGWRLSHGRGYEEADQSAVDEECPDTNMVRVMRVSKVYNPIKKIRARGTIQTAGGESAAGLVSRNGQVVALNDVSFSVKKRDCVALLGVNGSGKSTMFKILTAAISPTRGKATIDSCDVTEEPRETSMRYGYCSQGNLFYNDMSVREHLELFYRLQCRGHNDVSSEGAKLDELIRRLNLIPVEKTAALHLSGGNKRRLMLALSLLSDRTSLLLLDEPSAGVDVVARRLMWRVLHEKRQSDNRICCLFTTHSMEEAEAVCANAVVLFKGKIVWCGSIPDLKQRVSRGISISVRLNSSAIWNSGQVKHYTEEIRRLLQSKPPTGARQKGLERSSLPFGDLDEAWEHCHGLLYKTRDAVSMLSRQRGKTWLAGLRARFGSDNNAPRDVLKRPAVDAEAQPAIPIIEFVQEWLVQEAFVRLESQLFTDEFTSRSGESVTAAGMESACGSGNNTSGVYETSCTDTFGLADVFALMEANKQAFNILQYSVICMDYSVSSCTTIYATSPWDT
uniref:ABC transporter domain-containing protein n=1 Tax=Hyaloperonospora arabidopsidis (strain Emoy2) TaxID=559515 RepID=M4B855_HYAAE